MASTSILLVGSYNGQDSFGDKCLLRCVVANMQDAFGEKTEFISHIHTDIEESKREFSEIKFRKGLSPAYWAWHNRLRHLHFPFFLHALLSFFSFPFFLCINKPYRALLREILQDIKRVKLLYFYGGTQLSRQWFWFNFLPLLYTILLCRLYSVKVFFGPQQYGPETKIQRILLRITIRLSVKAVRARNANCLNLLGLAKNSLCYDEVFSSMELRPPAKPAENKRNFIMLNIRGTDFIDEQNTHEKEYEALSKTLILLQQKLKIPFKLFQMSGDSFCDDTSFLTFLKNRKIFPLDITALPYSKSAAELVELMSEALGTLSMSFHGCILSIVAGTPAVPMEIGEYYKYKYADFARYTGGQNPPIIDTETLYSEGIIDKICSYFSEYQTSVTAKVKERANALIREWYQVLKQNPRVDATHEG